ncbi:MAG: 1-acyl-sn-glycerol-3-phosphate acyltransferase [Acidobacteriales bacterium]|nr:1-acyl-sn-glycerol-3-phosphate acyltransferase [Terriglobales bacterium]
MKLLWTASACLLAYLLLRLRLLRAPSHAERARWLHTWCAVALPRLGVDFAAEGPMPARGLLVSNHLSYLDIMTLSAIGPCVFVSKKEVRQWPLFGLLATLAGTVYVDRQRAADAVRVNEELTLALQSGALCVLFPEGTSSNGAEVLPFRSPLLEAAVQSEAEVTAGYIRYELDEGDAAQDVCYWGEMTFLPHVLKLLSRPAIRARVRFAEESFRFDDRKEAAARTRERVIALREG